MERLDKVPQISLNRESQEPNPSIFLFKCCTALTMPNSVHKWSPALLIPPSRGQFTPLELFNI